MKLLIVDDEAIIREGLRSSIDWQEIGIDAVYTAENGLEALDSFCTHGPEIVITDIKMPGMDGLELSEKIVELGKNVHIIILSGYSEFAYAKRAMRLGVTDYELKPVDLESLKNLVSNAIDRQRQERSREKFNHQAESVYWNTVVQKVLLDNMELDDSLLEGLSGYSGINPTQEIICLLAEPDIGMCGVTVSDLPVAIRHHLHAIGHVEGFLVCDGEKEQKVIVLAVPAHWTRFVVKELHDSLCSAMESDGAGSISIGVSETGNLRMLFALREQAELALRHKFYRTAEIVLYYEDIKGIRGTVLQSVDVDDLLGAYMMQREQKAAQETVGQMFDRLVSAHCIQPEAVRSMCKELAGTMVRLIHNMHILLRPEYEVSFKRWSELPEYDTIDGYRTWALRTLSDLFEIMDTHKPVRNKALMMRCAAYIQEHFRESLTVGDLASFIQRSPNYLSHLFKMGFGISFSEYVNQVRIREAQRLLRHTDMLVYEIARETGFSDYDYFKQVFKRVAGTSPSDYRNGIMHL
ncbi:response regulator [Diplocloster hominis]|uniref:response regulator n=1 Tax=Diplocloster hominis TaxID=3079010 RepID=UPI0031BA789E